MVNSLENTVKQFNDCYLIKNEDSPIVPSPKQLDLMVSLVTEELNELMTACEAHDILEVADAIGDLIYVIAQQGVTWGFPIDALIREIHKSNLSKLDSEGNPIIREDGKILKGPHFTPPDISKVLKEYK